MLKFIIWDVTSVTKNVNFLFSFPRKEVIFHETWYISQLGQTPPFHPKIKDDHVTMKS